MAWTKCVCMKPFISVLVLDDSKFFRSKNRNDAKSLLLNLCTVWFIQQLVTNWKRGFYRNVITFNMESDIFSFFLINNGNQKRQDRPTLPQSLRFPLAGIFHTRKHIKCTYIAKKILHIWSFRIIFNVNHRISRLIRSPGLKIYIVTDHSYLSNYSPIQVLIICLS